MKKSGGWRKLAFGVIALLFLAAGFAACIKWNAGFVGFAAYATGVCTITGAVVVGNVGEHFASKGEKEPTP